MLEETIEKIIEECDLGPAIPTDRPIASAAHALTSCRFPKRTPLRC